MTETPSDPPPRTHTAWISSDDEPDTGMSDGRTRRVAWLAVISGLVLAVVFALVFAVPGQSREEKASIRAAVIQYAELFHESPQHIYKYHKIRTLPVKGGGYTVRITRVLVPDPISGFGITSIFEVDRNGTCRYVGRVEETKM